MVKLIARGVAARGVAARVCCCVELILNNMYGEYHKLLRYNVNSSAGIPWTFSGIVLGEVQNYMIYCAIKIKVTMPLLIN